MRNAPRALAAEVRAMLHQAWLLARARTIAVPLAPAPRVVVLVHGFMAKAPVLEPLAETIRGELALPVLSYDYASLASFERVAKGLATWIEREVPASARISLVGHSLGGVVCRWYVQELGGAARVDRIVTLATPHTGTPRAGFVARSTAAALHPRSNVVRTLVGRPDATGLPPLTSIVAEMDHLVPRHAAHVPGARMHLLDAIGHNGILYDPRAHRLVVEALREETQALARPPARPSEAG